jgi:hypothetical protein
MCKNRMREFALRAKDLIAPLGGPAVTLKIRDPFI